MPRQAPRYCIHRLYPQWDKVRLPDWFQSHSDIVQAHLERDCQHGFTLGPFALTDMPHVHTSRIGIIPKKHQPGKWRIIIDLSSPRDKSVNDGIAKADCSLTYTKVDEIVDSVLHLGRGALLAKINIRSAFRIIPIHPADRHLLGIEWKNQLYIDAALPFGLRSAPKIFNALADALAKLPHHFIRLNEDFKSDVAWWSLFLSSWKGSAMMSSSKPAIPTATVTSDASGSWGC